MTLEELKLDARNSYRYLSDFIDDKDILKFYSEDLIDTVVEMAYEEGLLHAANAMISILKQHFPDNPEYDKGI